MEYSGLSSASINDYSWGGKVRRVLIAALQAVDPFQAVATNLEIDGENLKIAGQTYNLASHADIYLIGAGKAGAPMSRAVASVL
ncbi:MAG: DUF4147 domain-containing protein, partial [Anaerolineales bacterium]